jgi:hypothetical protein
MVRWITFDLLSLAVAQEILNLETPIELRGPVPQNETQLAEAGIIENTEQI